MCGLIVAETVPVPRPLSVSVYCFVVTSSQKLGRAIELDRPVLGLLAAIVGLAKTR